jgi:hypothetical protein
LAVPIETAPAREREGSARAALLPGEESDAALRRAVECQRHLVDPLDLDIADIRFVSDRQAGIAALDAALADVASGGVHRLMM